MILKRIRQYFKFENKERARYIVLNESTHSIKTRYIASFIISLN